MKPGQFIDLADERARIIAALAGIGACLVGTSMDPTNLEERAKTELPVLCAAFNAKYDPETTKAALQEVIQQELERRGVNKN